MDDKQITAKLRKWIPWHMIAVQPEAKTQLDALLDEIDEQAIKLSEVTEDTSDGWHSFKELYHHRALLFSVIVHDYRDMCWKSKKHHDGKELDWNFIVGIDTPWGQASYHYGMEYWDLFDCKVVEQAPYYDGYTADESVSRIARLVELDNARDQLIYALGECRHYAYLCEYCPHKNVDFDTDPQHIPCSFDFDQLYKAAGIEAPE